MACANNHEQVARMLIDLGADINLQNLSKNTSLHWAALTGHLNIVKMLCENEK